MDQSPVNREAILGALNHRLDWNLLRTYLVIVEQRGISRAAAKLCLTQPAVSRSLQRLEAYLGVRLISKRTPQQFVLTPAGEEVYRIAGEVQGAVSRLGVGLAAGQGDVSGLLVLLTVSRIESAVYDRCLAEFHRRYPRVELRLEVMRSSDIIHSLLQKTASLGLCLSRFPVAKLEQTCIFPQRYALYCGRHHPLFGVADLGLADLLAENFVSFSSDQIGDYLSPLTIFREQAGFRGQIVATSSSLDEVERLIFAGYGIGALPSHLLATKSNQQRLWRLPPQQGVADVDIYLMWHKERVFSPLESAFVEHFLAFMSAYPAAERLGLAD
ncbi:LysR family transcriptional regulator [Neisseriaceae bacterium TC5R-5]|nr:LysR family transcriptional regulator [Neisseriaceae bacterium TC5R-5]